MSIVVRVLLLLLNFVWGFSFISVGILAKMGCDERNQATCPEAIIYGSGPLIFAFLLLVIFLFGRKSKIIDYLFWILSIGVPTVFFTWMGGVITALLPPSTISLTAGVLFKVFAPKIFPKYQFSRSLFWMIITMVTVFIISGFYFQGLLV